MWYLFMASKDTMQRETGRRCLQCQLHFLAAFGNPKDLLGRRGAGRAGLWSQSSSWPRSSVAVGPGPSCGR